MYVQDEQEEIVPSFQDTVSTVDERSSERMNFRTKPQIKWTIQRAAALAGVDDSVFTMNAAGRSGMETIAAHERTVLQPVDHQALFAALDNVPAPTKHLHAAFAERGAGATADDHDVGDVDRRGGNAVHQRDQWRYGIGYRLPA